MGKLDTSKKLIKIASEDPEFWMRTRRHVSRCGFRRLVDYFRDEVRRYNSADSDESPLPGSVQGSIRFSVVMPTYNVDVKWVDLAIRSVCDQTYANWELCIADDASDNEDLIRYLEGISGPRVHVLLAGENEGISAASNKAAAVASGDYIVLLDDDDILLPNALEELYYEVGYEQPDIVYSDNDVIDENGNRVAALYKPDWSPDLFYSQMYMGHLVAFKRTLFEKVGGFRSEMDGSQDYDLILRMLATGASVEHINRILYSWRAIQTSTSANANAKPYAQAAGLSALESYMHNTFGNNVEVRETDDLFVYDVRWPLPLKPPKASLIIPTKDHVEDLRRLVDSILSRTDYPNYEIVIINNQTSDLLTLDYFEQLVSTGTVRIVDAEYDFNWSKVNNHGARECDGDVLVFLNNDVEVISLDWLTRLVENAIRPDIGFVGGLLLYPDGTIQHAGVVVGMGGWADHVYKGCAPVHCGNPFISPMVPRDVSAVTGACMAVSRDTFDELGGFDEDFIVCGSDVEICLRALKHGLRNLYTPHARLYHLESKTRNPADVPSTDFDLSRIHYREMIAAGDPYFSKGLDIDSTTPVMATESQIRIEDCSKHWPDVRIPELYPLHLKKGKSTPLRLNLVVPSVNDEHVFGGIATAIDLFLRLINETGAKGRIIVLGATPESPKVVDALKGFRIVDLDEDADDACVIVAANIREEDEGVFFTNNDWFMCTMWSTAFCLQQELGADGMIGCGYDNPIIYLIQDFEPGFYPWSAYYLLADSTYRDSHPTVAVFNSIDLQEYFHSHGYDFAEEYSFNPVLNGSLRKILRKSADMLPKRKQILVYGRPSVERNAFPLIVESLRRFIGEIPDSAAWDFVSVGECHAPVPLGSGRWLVSLGKLNLEEYARVLQESYAGISLMVSPHPSYPPLEMAAFGVQVITNSFSGKTVAEFSENIHVVSSCTPSSIGSDLVDICNGYTGEVPKGGVPKSYLEADDPYPFVKELAAYILRKMHQI